MKTSNFTDVKNPKKKYMSKRSDDVDKNACNRSQCFLSIIKILLENNVFEWVHILKQLDYWQSNLKLKYKQTENVDIESQIPVC